MFQMAFSLTFDALWTPSCMFFFKVCGIPLFFTCSVSSFSKRPASYLLSSVMPKQSGSQPNICDIAKGIIETFSNYSITHLHLHLIQLQKNAGLSTRVSKIFRTVTLMELTFYPASSIFHCYFLIIVIAWHQVVAARCVHFCSWNLHNLL